MNAGELAVRVKLGVLAAMMVASGAAQVGAAQASDITVMMSAAFKEAYDQLVPQFENASRHRVVTIQAPTVDMMTRLKGGETVDLVIMAAPAVDALIRDGKIVAGSSVNVARSGIGVAVRKGAPKPDIGSADALKKALLAAPSIAYSTGPSGVYLAHLFERMGIADQLMSKVKQIKGEPVGAVVARGDAEIGFQQVSELLPVPGIEFLGPLPEEIQEITVFAVGLHVGAKEPDGAKALVKFLTAPDAAPVIKKTGMQPG
jgi:molybdate transport system substrate-binding protein